MNNSKIHKKTQKNTKLQKYKQNNCKKIKTKLLQVWQFSHD